MYLGQDAIVYFHSRIHFHRALHSDLTAHLLGLDYKNSTDHRILCLFVTMYLGQDVIVYFHCHRALHTLVVCISIRVIGRVYL